MTLDLTWDRRPSDCTSGQFYCRTVGIVEQPIKMSSLSQHSFINIDFNNADHKNCDQTTCGTPYC